MQSSKYQPSRLGRQLKSVWIATFVFSLSLLSISSYGQILEFHQKDTTDQNKTYPRYRTLEFKLQYGVHAPTGVDELEETVEANPYTSTEFRIGWKGYGRRKWHRFYKFPTYGFGLYQAYFVPSSSSLGNPSAMYAFLNAPFVRWKKTSFVYDIGIGLAYNFLGYDPEKNPEQTAIGSEHNVYFNLSLEYAFPISDRFDMTAGFNFTHFSNGRTRTPNKGVNLLSLNAAVKYNLRPTIKGKGYQKDIPIRPEYITHDLPKFKGFWEYMFYAHGGWTTSVDNIEDRNLYYGVGSLGFDVGRHLAYISKITLGFDYFFDGSLAEEYADEYGGKDNVPSSKLSYPGVHIGHELMIHRVTLIVNYGRTFEDVKGRGDWYARVGGKYDITRNFHARIALKTPGGFAADFIEWGLGVNFYSKKKYLE